MLAKASHESRNLAILKFEVDKKTAENNQREANTEQNRDYACFITF